MQGVSSWAPTALVAAVAWLGYGPARDHSEFLSAGFVNDGTTVLFTSHELVYQPATGWRAFPDGGIPRYLKDVNVIGAYEMRSGKSRTLYRQRNTRWQPGSGGFTIQAVNGNKALIGHGGQSRGTFASAIYYLLVDIPSGKCLDLDLKAELAKKGREPGVIYLVDENGTLVFVTAPLQPPEVRTASRDTAPIPEIWVRTPNGQLLKAAVSAHYECTKNGELIYWDPATRTFLGYSISTHQTRTLAGYKQPGYQDVTKGVIVGSDRRHLELGDKFNGEWHYRPLEVTP
jgi:hypothetical protein